MEQFPTGAVAPFTGGCNVAGWKSGVGSQGTAVCVPNGGPVNQGSPIYPVRPMNAGLGFAPWQSTNGAGPIPSAVGQAAGIPQVLTDVFCSWFPDVCNIGTPGSGFPTPDPTTPAPGDVPGSAGPGAGAPRGQYAAPAGWHWNKGTYWTKQGVVYRGTRLVKNRRMNPLNPRALARAIRRGDSFVRFAKGFNLRAPATGGIRKKSCRR